jgi:hypothetical protein
MQLPDRQVTLESPVTETLTNFENISSVRIEYIAQDSSFAKDINISGSTLRLHEKPETLDRDKYQVYYALKNTDTKDKTDIYLSVDKENRKLLADFSGLPSRSLVSISVGNEAVLQATPVDWAGRLIGQMESNSNLKDKDICIAVDKRDNGPIGVICHHVTSGENANTAAQKSGKVAS